jgi:inhibitor of cysteine peptidase
VGIAAKPGYSPKTVGAVDAYPAHTVQVLPGDRVMVHLNAKAGTWVPQGMSKQLVVSKPVKKGSTTIVTYEARNRGIATPVLWAEPSAGWPAQAYAFSAVVGKGSLPKTVTAVERKVARTIETKPGELFDIVLPGNPTTGYLWALSPLAVDGVVEQVGEPTFTPESDEMGAPGTVTMHFKAVGAGSVPMTLLYEKGDGQTDAESMYMTMVTVQ